MVEEKTKSDIEKIKKEVKETKKEESKVLVVKEYPVQQMKQVVDEEGKQYTLITIEEALQEMLENIRKITKAVA